MRSNTTRSRRSQIRRGIGIAAALIIVPWLILVVSLLGWGYSRTISGEYDAIIVAGCRLEKDGSPSRPLRARVEAAVSHFEAGAADMMMFTGGLGQSGRAEAEAAADYAHELGVPYEAIRMEDRSTSTWENALFAREALPTADRVLVVSDGYHLFRVEQVFAQHFEDVDVAPAPLSLVDLPMATRELAAIIYYIGLGRF